MYTACIDIAIASSMRTPRSESRIYYCYIYYMSGVPRVTDSGCRVANAARSGQHPKSRTPTGVSLHDTPSSMLRSPGSLTIPPASPLVQADCGAASSPHPSTIVVERLAVMAAGTILPNRVQHEVHEQRHLVIRVSTQRARTGWPHDGRPREYALSTPASYRNGDG